MVFGLSLILCLVVAVAACGGNNGETSPEVKRGATEFVPPPTDSLTFVADPKVPLRWTRKIYRMNAGRIELRVKNPSVAPHSVGVEMSKRCCKQPGDKQFGTSKTVDTGEATGLVVELAPGRYWAYCGVDGHWQGGMVSRLIVN